MNGDVLKKELVPKYLAMGEPKFSRILLTQALYKLVEIEKGTYKGLSPDLEYLECYEQLIFLYRREGEENFLHISRVFRRLAHRIYRIMLKKKMTTKSPKFLNLV
jgi:hypothetical protein